MKMDQLPYTGACILIEFSAKASQQAISWLVERIRADKRYSGCQLTVSELENSEDVPRFLISGPKHRMKVGAEMYGIRKRHKDGSMREFVSSDEENFENYEDDDFITDAECLYILKSELDSLRAHEEDHIPGHENNQLYPGKSILRKLLSAKLISNVFCLHDETKLDKLCVTWYKNKTPTIAQPINDIHNYFGDNICIYFAFLGYYTKGLLPLILASVPFHIMSSNWNEIQSYSGFAAINVIWAAIFLEMWKRKSADLAYKFGNFQKHEWEEPRGAFRGYLGMNPITGRREPCYPKWKRRLRICLISIPIVTLCIASAVSLMFYYFSWDFHFANEYDSKNTIVSKVLRNIPSIVYSVVVLIANTFYRKLAEYLTDQENHRLESSYQNHLVAKIVLFDFVNNFLCLFYIAFIYNNISMLRMTLRNLFIIQIIISQTLESLFPYWRYLRRSRIPGENSARVSKISVDVSKQVDLEIKRDIYEGTFDDYLEMWLQFGYVVMFSCAFPIASVLAFINNVVEIRSDAFKICNVFRRPFSIPTGNIGAWQIAFEVISYLGVISNCALIFQSKSFQSWFYLNYPSASNIDLLVVFIVTEHLLLIGRYIISGVIPAVPEYISIAVAKMHYRSLKALKRERAKSLHSSEVISAVRVRGESTVGNEDDKQSILQSG